MRYSIVLVVLLCSSCSYNELIPVCEPDEQIFSDLVKPIIESSCINCHGDNGTPPLLKTYNNVMDAVNNHGLENEIVNLQMPPGGGLNQSDIETITNWITCE